MEREVFARKVERSVQAQSYASVCGCRWVGKDVCVCMLL